MELGETYGLIFINRYSETICTSLDGKSIKTVANQGQFHKLFLDDKILYYTNGNSLYQWPEKLVRNFQTEAQGIGKYRGEIIVALPQRKQIAFLSKKEVLFGCSLSPLEITVLNDELYHGGSFNFEISDSEVYSLTVLDNKLYLGTSQGIISRCKGRKKEALCQIDFPLRSLHGIDGEGVIYAGGGSRGIMKISLRERNKKTILRKEACYANSIVHAPLELIGEVNKS